MSLPNPAENKFTVAAKNLAVLPITSFKSLVGPSRIIIIGSKIIANGGMFGGVTVAGFPLASATKELAAVA
jgi:hypothetical protein